MGKHSSVKAIYAKREQEFFENQRKYIASLEARLLPGQKLMTCPYCNKICCVPVWQVMINCIRYGINGGPTHPGEIYI